MSYTLCRYNGNCGSETTFETFEEAVREGDLIWNSLSKNDKIRYTDREAGAHFFILENDDDDVHMFLAYDYANELQPYVVPWMTYNTWSADTCLIAEVDDDADLHCFEVTMVRDGEQRAQTIYPLDLEDQAAIRTALDAGADPVRDGWEDGMGNTVCWENAGSEEE